MTLYRKNMLLSQELLGVISYFEVTFRNKIDRYYLRSHGNDWIFNSPSGMFSSNKCAKTKTKINEKIKALGKTYSHDKMVAGMEFGFWVYLFAHNHYLAGGSTLLEIFPNKPKSNRSIQYNQSFVFDQLRKIKDLRNRIAHHEPICFAWGTATIDTSYARRLYEIVLELFQWMAVDEKSLMDGLDHVLTICDEIDSLSPKSTSLLSLQ